MRKRITSLLLTLVMLLSLVPAMGVTASAGEMLPFHEVGTYQELIDAVHSGKPRIKLKNDINTRDVYASGIGIPEDKMITIGYDAAITLDLNGCTLALETLVRGGFSFFTVYGELEIKDSSPSQNGKITGKFPSVLASMFRTQGGTLTLQSGTLMTSSNKNDVITVGSSGGHVVINGGRICSGKWDTSSASPCGYAVLAVTDFADVEKMEVIINGGVFDGAVGFFPRSEFTCKEPRFHIYGGTFKQDVLLRCGQKTFKTHSPILEICGGSFEGGLKIYDWGMDPIDRYGDAAQSYPPFKLLGGTFSCTVDLCYEKSYWGFDSPKLDQFIGALKYERMRPVFAAMLENSAIVKPSDTYTAVNIDKGMDWALREGYGTYYQMLLKGTAANPIRIIPNAWGMKSVTLDGNPIDYAKDWKGEVERMDNSTAHTLKFEWKPLAQELKDAGYSYRTKCEHYISGSSAVQHTDTIAADETSHTITISAGADPKVYSYDLQLNLDKNGSSVGIISNEHIVKLVVSEAPVVEPDPTIAGKVYYTSGIVYGRPISTAASVTPADATKAYQWQRSTDSGSTWTDIERATSGRYTPVAADMGENVRIRVVVTAEGYLGEIVGAAVKVSKAANDNTPAPPAVGAQKDDSDAYTKFEISDFNSNQEYVYTSSPASGSEWPTGGTEITSATVENLTAGSTYYIYTRYKETDTHTAGSKISSSSVLLDEITKLNRIVLTDESGKVYGSYGNGNTIYIQNGTSMTLTATTNPSGANRWSAFTFKSQYNASAPFTVTAPTDSVASGAEIPTVTIHGDTAGTGTLAAEYGGYPAPQSYGTWRVHVYENVSDIGTGAEITVSSSFPDMTMYQDETMPLPEHNVSVYPVGALDNYNLAWRIIKVGSGGAAYSMSDDNITLDDGKIKATASHTAPSKTRLELVAVNKTDDMDIRSFSPSIGFYVTVTEAPAITLTGLTVSPAKVNLANVNDTYQLSAVKEPVNAAGSLTWESSNTGVATVDDAGNVKAVAAGTATITVKYGTISASCTVTVAHTHNTDAQSWVYMDPGMHIKTCTAGDDFKVEAHDFSAWTKVDDTNHSRTCNKCKKSGETANYTETAEHTWVWVVDQEAALNQPGKQHEECTGCHAKRSENTEIPALQDYAVAVTGGTATVAAGTITRAMEGVEVTVTAQAPAGKHFVKWVVKAGGVTLANETSATTTFIMPATDVAIEANFEKNASTGGGGGGSYTPSYTVSVDKTENGTITVSPKSASKGSIVTITVKPDKGYTLETLTVLDKNGYALELTEKNGRFTFKMPASAVIVKATFMDDNTMLNLFVDVKASDYFYDAVLWAAEKGVTSGTDALHFSPNAPCTRAQIVTFLWRAAGSPAPKNMSSFADVPADAFYAKAVAWAVENGITGGTGDGKFSPDATCTRAQSVTFLYRAAGSPKVSSSAEFGDVATNAYYADAVAWAAKNGITGGIGGSLFGSDNNCTRAQIVTFLYRSVK